MTPPDAPPSGRVRAVDAYRAFAILMVVAGHWLAVTLRVEDGRLTGQNLLEVWPAGAWLTWGFQVMPVFFLVGGYASAASWAGRRPEVTTLSWLGGRLWRLLLPSLVLLVVVTAVATGARLAGADEALVGLALAVAGLPLWFLAVYLVVVAATPALVLAEQRWGVRVPGALIVACVGVDALAVHGGLRALGLVNFALFWLGVFAAGVAWRSGRLTGAVRHPWALAGVSLVALILLVQLGPYPVSMINAPGEEVQNNGPPSTALVALAMTQLGVVLGLHDAVERWCRRRRVWAMVVVVNAHAMSIYLWHLVAALVAGFVFWRLGLVTAATAPSAGWWLQRPLWYAVCALALLVIVRLVRPVEWRRPVLRAQPATRRRVVLTVTGVGLSAAGMLQLTLGGLTAGPAGLPLAGLATFLFGMLAVRVGTGITGSSTLTWSTTREVTAPDGPTQPGRGRPRPGPAVQRRAPRR